MEMEEQGFAKVKSKRKNTETKTKNHAKRKRVRTDTFWFYSLQENGNYFDSILEGLHDLYYVDQQADVNLDSKAHKRTCWMVRHKETEEMVDGLRNTQAYRLSLAWSVYSYEFWKTSERKQRVATAIPTALTKRGLHCRHLCPNSWCCNPGHIQIGSRSGNEIDKHFHHFLKMKDYSILFMDTFRQLCKEQGVWGFYPPPKEEAL